MLLALLDELLLRGVLPLTHDELVQSTVATVPRVSTLSKFKTTCQLLLRVLVGASIGCDSILAADEET